jgi:protein TonB
MVMLVIPLACAGLAVAGFVGGRLVPLRGATLSKGQLDFAAKPVGDNVAVTWSATSPIVRQAQRGLLVVVDGDRADRVELNNQELSIGRYTYSPHSTNLSFVLTVYRDDNNFVGGSADLDVGSEKALTVVAPANSIDAPPAISSEEIDSPVSKNQRREADRAAASANTEKAAPRKAFLPPKPAAAAAQSPQMVPPPELVASNVPPQVALPGGVSVPPPAQPVTMPQASARREQVTYTQPVPITRVTPQSPKDARVWLRDTVVIQVTVDIDATGHVTKANAMDLSAIDRRVLSVPAVAAAKEWTFAPAKRNGVPVPSQTVLEFRFNRQ